MCANSREMQAALAAQVSHLGRHPTLSLSKGNNLLSAAPTGRQILRFAQDDNP
jgi:hypothetical protein